MRSWFLIAVALLAAVPWLVLRFVGFHDPPYQVAVLTGIAILGAAFLLTWAAEVIQIDVSQALAVVVLSLIAVLPEYSVDLYFAWQAGKDPSYAPFAIANMTGANRLLIGIGWAAVVLVFWWRTGRRSVDLGREEMLELSVLSLATLYAFIIPLKGDLSVLDAVVLLALFGTYAFLTSRQPAEEPDIEGPARAIAALTARPRRLIILGLFVYAAFAILASAEPFAESLIASGRLFGIDEFILVQWLAPFASEAPEFIVAVLFTLRGHPHLGLRTMISSKVNQWTLLVGAIPIAYSISGGHLMPMVLDGRQLEEVFLTAAQSAFAVALLAGLGLSLHGAAALAGLFLVQFFLPETRLFMGVLYLLLAAGLLLGDRSRLHNLIASPRAMFSPAATSNENGRRAREKERKQSDARRRRSQRRQR